MGTNYYVRYNICPHCDRYDSFHLGKSSYGWQFLFHCIEGDEINLKHFDPKYVLLNEDCFISLANYESIKKFISTYVDQYKTAKIFDEYDKEISSEEFFDMVKKKQIPENKNHAEETYDYANSYVDTAGYSFSKGEFS